MLQKNIYDNSFKTNDFQELNIYFNKWLHILIYPKISQKEKYL